MIRQIIVPTENTFLLRIPNDLIGKQVEVIAFSNDELTIQNSEIAGTPKRTIEEALSFYKKNSVDFTKIEKWNREDLYE